MGGNAELEGIKKITNPAIFHKKVCNFMTQFVGNGRDHSLRNIIRETDKIWKISES
jgi:hypothetical protein